MYGHHVVELSRPGLPRADHHQSSPSRSSAIQSAQVEVGLEAPSFPAALRASLRQDSAANG